MFLSFKNIVILLWEGLANLPTLKERSDDVLKYNKI